MVAGGFGGSGADRTAHCRLSRHGSSRGRFSGRGDNTGRRRHTADARGGHLNGGWLCLRYGGYLRFSIAAVPRPETAFVRREMRRRQPVPDRRLVTPSAQAAGAPNQWVSAACSPSASRSGSPAQAM
ncbi:hypothetical protein SLNWT_1967 [Streptomyces albus]|uniref:Uncharacterized protein n=1 Tax=Streptomyces albus (strain ATCC 21838 / DSM 41398 / FERM P-419 / JCM 4703 / NBRC 107858) TaxID=1081613 RepID=A0A0B5EJC5_STRA4|nr:hypothetical protein SLNWT_1967 [Streptomyces albus]AOU76659.1 hypothetical protein SLNHY_1968 [Streptomyces albus]AYN32439.1 hypothetical protein DUI70_1937 [Streptomyces albus]